MRRTTPDRPLDIEALFPELRHHRATATRLHPRPGRPEPTDSSVGGPLLWPAAEPWPTCTEVHRKSRGELVANIRNRRRILDTAWSRLGPDGRPTGPTDAEREELKLLGKRGKYAPDIADEDPIPMLPVLQLFRRDVPELGFPDGKDLLQVLWCPFDAHGDDRRISVELIWRDSSQVVDALAESPEIEVVGNAGYVPEPCLLHPEDVVEHQDFDLLPGRLQKALEKWERRSGEDGPQYQFDFSVAPGWKVGGFASWHLTGPETLTCGCGAQMRPLITVDGREWDGGSLSWRPVEDADNPAFDLNVPTRVVVGRDGSLRVFSCTKDVRHPYVLSEQ